MTPQEARTESHCSDSFQGSVWEPSRRWKNRPEPWGWHGLTMGYSTMIYHILPSIYDTIRHMFHPSRSISRLSNASPHPISILTPQRSILTIIGRALLRWQVKAWRELKRSCPLAKWNQQSSSFVVSSSGIWWFVVIFNDFLKSVCSRVLQCSAPRNQFRVPEVQTWHLPLRPPEALHGAIVICRQLRARLAKDSPVASSEIVKWHRDPPHLASKRFTSYRYRIVCEVLHGFTSYSY